MVIHPRDNFKNIVKILDIINPFLIIISIIGLFCEYTFLKAYVLLPNKIISVIFVFDFALRIISYKPILYLTKGYGWVDFLASLPGIFFFLDNTPLFAVFKIIKVGRFFKIIRILRFLRVFSFLKKMKSDSIWIQDRIMKIGVTIVMIFVVGIIVIDNKATSSLQMQESRILESDYIAANGEILTLVKNRKDILFYTNDSILFSREGQKITDYSIISDLISSELDTYLIMQIEEGVYSPIDNLILPITGIIMEQGQITDYLNSIMLSLLTTLLVILTVIIFYMGFVFAKDMQIIQLIIDSFDAGDDFLLQQEAENYKNDEGDLIINPDESELTSLLKAAANHSSGSSSGTDSLLMGLVGMGDPIVPQVEVQDYSIDNSRELIEETVKRLTPAIIKYIKKELKD
ncbi:MAG: ion transporter [Spirochaetaceae bacterium]